MRGNKFVLKIIMVLAILCVGIASNFLFLTKPKKAVEAEDNSIYNKSYCSQQYDDGVIFSAEQVYVADKRTSGLAYNSEGYLANGDQNFTNIIGNEGNNYFGNYGLGVANANKKIIRSGEHVMIDDKAEKTAYDESKTPLIVRQGVMITLGGYVFDNDLEQIFSNSAVNSQEKNYNANLTYIKVVVKKDGQEISGLVPRTIDGDTFDWVHFITIDQDDPSGAEGHYTFSIEYTYNGKLQAHEFDFYLLINSVYTKVSEINGNNYSANPNIENASFNENTNKYEANIYNDEQPIISYDYMHYDFSYTYVVNDLVTSVVVEYQATPSRMLVIKSTTNNTTTTTEYPCSDNGNNIVSFLFSNIGDYTFKFNYVHYEENVRTVISELQVENIRLYILGYEMKYAKTGYYSSNFRKLYLVENGTQLIPVGGYKNSEATETSSATSLGYMYDIVSGTEKTGSVKNIETTDITNKNIEDNLVINGNSEIEILDQGLDILSDVVNTDQGGVWLSLNDEYQTGGYYLYSSTPFVRNTNYNKITLNKETTFTNTGYYFVSANSKYNGISKTQYFAFKLSSTVANLKLYVTDEPSVPDEEDFENLTRIYSNQFTNKSVFATWVLPSTFESNQKVKIYSSIFESNCYQSKSTLLAFANGESNNQLISNDYTRESLITRKGSYLLELSIVGSQTKAYYYFTIDKDDISNVDLLGTSLAYLGTTPIYSVAKNSSNEAISYGDKLFVDKAFTIWWDDKLSGAKVKASYTFTPMISSDDDSIIDVNGTDYKLIYADYTFGSTSGSITIDKPNTKSSILDSNNVLNKAGIYWFDLEDEAGNQMSYMVVFDDSKAKIIVKDTSGNELSSGDVSNTDVTVEWGTHKAIKLGEKLNFQETLLSIINETFDGKYYTENHSNFNLIKDSIYGKSVNSLSFIIKNEKVKIKTDGYEGEISSDNYTHIGDDKNIAVNSNGHYVTLMVDEYEKSYSINLFGNNQVNTSDSVSYFVVTLNADKSEGTVRSTASVNEDYKKVRVVNDLNNYLSGQATNDSLLVFDWKSDNNSEYYKVGKVYFEYYPLMTQDELNTIDLGDELATKYYPYAYHEASESTRTYIYGGPSNARLCYTVSENGNTFYRSQTINANYVLYYDDEGNLISKTATSPGMYVITREYEDEFDEIDENEKDTKIKNYVFFVDRNKIIDYSPIDNTVKTVGSYIKWYLQNSLGFSNYTQESSTVDVSFDGVINSCNIFLETNRLPLEALVPTGKYASVLERDIQRTSNSISGGLKMEIWYQDNYNILGHNSANDKLSFKLYDMADMQKNGISYDIQNYINYALNSDSLVSSSYILEYLNACNQKGDKKLSLPGYYFIKIYDNVGSEISERDAYLIANPSTLILGFKITKEAPSFSLQANQNPLDNINGERTDFSSSLIFSTSKAYIRYMLKKADNESYSAQIDTNYISVLQDGKAYNITSETTFNYNGQNIKYIQNVNGDVYIWLDTGLEIRNGKIVDYKEYTYTINVRYILGENNDYMNSYIYNTAQGVQQYYEKTVTVKIDRTAFMENLKNILSSNNNYPGQVEFLEEFIDDANDQDAQLSGRFNTNLYNTVGYRGLDGSDNYAVVNKLYYYYVDKGDKNRAKGSIYAIRVNENTSFTQSTNEEKNNSLYYREFNGLMALLPVCDTYYSDSTGYDLFTRNSSSQFSYSDNMGRTWGSILPQSGYYEIIEVDEAGNYTQYVVLFIKDNDMATSYNIKVSFEDLTREYDVNFNFANITNNSLTFSPEVNVVYGGETHTGDFMLNLFQNVTDMFGNSTNNLLENSYTDLGIIDKYYKVSFIVGQLTNPTNSTTIFTNSLNINLSKIIAEKIVEYRDANYTIRITNRFNQTLSISFLNSENPDQFSLNIDNFKAEKDGSDYYVNFESLTTTIDQNDQRILFYATEINLFELDTETSSTYTRDAGVWKLNGLEVGAKIKLNSNSTYLATIKDLKQQIYTKYLYAYENPTDDKIDCYGKHETISNVYYTANIVDVSFSSIIYNGQKVKISLDGTVIFNSSVELPRVGEEKEIKIYDNIYMRVSFNEQTKYYVARFYPYQSNLTKADLSGSLIEIQTDLYYNESQLKTYNIIIDNRFGALTFMADDENKANNLLINYFGISENEIDNVVNKDSLTVGYTKASLFKLAPQSTLSDEVYLNWQDMLDIRYLNSYNNPYFNLKLHLFKFISKDEMTELDITQQSYRYVAPEVDMLGRYVFVAELRNSSNEIIVYKAYAFNVSTTANAMYKVQDPDGNKMNYVDFVFGRDLVGENGLFSFESIKNIFSYTDVNDAKYKSFLAQKVPVYISNRTLTVVRNGDNSYAVTSMLLSYDEYTLYLYKIYNKVYETYLAILQIEETSEFLATSSDVQYTTNSDVTTNLVGETSVFVTEYGRISFPSYFAGSVNSEAGKKLVGLNRLYFEVYYTSSNDSAKVKVGDFYGVTNENKSVITFNTSGRYLLYLKDVAGNTRIWGQSLTGEDIEYLTITVIPEMILTVNGEVPVDYAYYNDKVTVTVAFRNYSNFYDNASVRMFAYRNGSSENYITTTGGRKTEYISEFTFTNYGTYRVVVMAKRFGNDIQKEIVFSIINPNEARMALDFTAISKYEIESVKNVTTDTDVTDTFLFLINEGYIYSKLITFERLSAENAFGANMGKQTFEVSYKAKDDEMVPQRSITFRFTINNETPTIQSSLKPGKTTTKKITLKFNPQAIFRQAGDCHIVINDTVVLSINEESATDEAMTITLKDASVYYVKIVTDSGRVLSSFKVTIKEPLNTWSIILIVAGILVVVGVIVTFIILRTKMKVR